MTYVPDTNVCIYALGGRLQSPWPVGDFVVSAVTQIELLSKPGLTASEEQSIQTLLAPMTVIELPLNLRMHAANLRRQFGIRTPDAIIVATAIVTGAELLSNDLQLAKIPGVTVRSLLLKP